MGFEFVCVCVWSDSSQRQVESYESDEEIAFSCASNELKSNCLQQMRSKLI